PLYILFDLIISILLHNYQYHFVQFTGLGEEIEEIWPLISNPYCPYPSASIIHATLEAKVREDL
ncbi:hypothetical protein OSJ97_25615, partial [Escherichia coli]|nr:hypothetical protein [Escherichia coli]